jgi:hypothetical protein
MTGEIDNPVDASPWYQEERHIRNWTWFWHCHHNVVHCSWNCNCNFIKVRESNGIKFQFSQWKESVILPIYKYCDKTDVIIRQGWHHYQVHTKSYPIFVSGLTPYIAKLYGIICMDFDKMD